MLSALIYFLVLGCGCMQGLVNAHLWNPTLALHPSRQSLTKSFTLGLNLYLSTSIPYMLRFVGMCHKPWLFSDFLLNLQNFNKDLTE